MRLAFVSCTELPGGSPDDAPAVRALADRGADVRTVAWDDPSVEWNGFDAIVMRSTWNYFRTPGRFRAWLDTVDAAAPPVFNPVDVLRWNADKRYLAELAERLDVVPTVWVEAPDELDPDALVGRVGADVVAKPRFGAAATGVRRLRADEAAGRAGLRDMLEVGAIMVQPYVREVASRGEWSLIYIGGAYSHSVLKRPADGEYRVQERLGATLHAGDPPDAVRRLADRARSAAGAEELLYARVDIIPADPAPLVVEVELLEPSLFLRQVPGSEERFADALLAALSTRGDRP